MICKVSFVVFVLFLLGSSSNGIPDSEVKSICSKTQNPAFCLSLLGSNPSATIVDLTQHVIDIARGNVSNTIKLISNLIAQSGKNPKAKEHYKACLEHFGEDGALGDVDYTQELLHKGDYQGVNLAAASIADDVDDCISGESPTDPSFNDLSPLPSHAKVIESVVAVLLVLSKSLGH
ncbi:hypothetical protein PHAVU_007G271600 [Phaseolus vulgaris]|uniref:Pectinesterase inhibitor domain-containing protein n=1 Tax=Phaseolus vulgaris TaxID=3885 RepID=V7BIP3_PHAVU|nr:hypothetical protein PHAVU_007G271600g [Phaseolus vulgaris]ESW17824.1 hypothetical protein PHAVU_007G271600g [Phaseolus vulgaris]